MSIAAMTWALNHAPAYLKPPERFVMVAFADYVGTEVPDAWPSVATLSRKTGLSRRTVQRALRTLQAARIISPAGPAPAVRNDRQTIRYLWHSELALTCMPHQVELVDDEGEQVEAAAPEPVGYAIVPVPLSNEQVAHARRHCVTPTVDNLPSDGASHSRGASHATPTGRHADARTKNLNHQGEPVGVRSDVTTDRARTRSSVQVCIRHRRPFNESGVCAGCRADRLAGEA